MINKYVCHLKSGAMLHRLTSEDTHTMDCIDMAEAGCERRGGERRPWGRIWGPIYPAFLGRKQKEDIPLNTQTTKGSPFPMLPPVSYLSLCPSHTPVSVLIAHNSALYKVFIRLTMFVFPLLLIKSRNAGKKYGRVTGFLMVPHLKCILKYVNQ